MSFAPLVIFSVHVTFRITETVSPSSTPRAVISSGLSMMTDLSTPLSPYPVTATIFVFWSSFISNPSKQPSQHHHRQQHLHQLPQQILRVESFYIIKNKGIRRSELNTAYRKSGAELMHDLKYYLGIGFIVFVEVIIILWEISNIIAVFSS